MHLYHIVFRPKSPFEEPAKSPLGLLPVQKVIPVEAESETEAVQKAKQIMTDPALKTWLKDEIQIYKIGTPINQETFNTYFYDKTDTTNE